MFDGSTVYPAAPNTKRAGPAATGPAPFTSTLEVDVTTAQGSHRWPVARFFVAVGMLAGAIGLVGRLLLAIV